MPKGELSWLGRVWGRLHLELGPAVPLPSFHPFFILLEQGKSCRNPDVLRRSNGCPDLCSGAGVLSWDPWREGKLLLGQDWGRESHNKQTDIPKGQERGKRDLSGRILESEQDPCVQLNSLQPGVQESTRNSQGLLLPCEIHEIIPG